MLAQLTAGYKPLAWTTGGVANSEFPRLRLKQCLKETNHNGTQHCLFYMKQTGRRGGALQKSKLDRNIALIPSRAAEREEVSRAAEIGGTPHRP